MARPLLLTVATLVALLAQVNVTPLIVLPLLSLAVALNCCVPPAAIDAVDGETAMVATVGRFVPEEPQPIDNDSTAREKTQRTHFATATRQSLFTRSTFL